MTAATFGEVTVAVDSRVMLNDSGLDVVSGQALAVRASGEWRDKGFRSDAHGYDPPWWLRVWTPLLRCRGGRWFELCGAVGRNGPMVPIGSRAQVIMPATGRLFLFANDVTGFYGNNDGLLRVVLSVADGP